MKKLQRKEPSQYKLNDEGYILKKDAFGRHILYIPLLFRTMVLKLMHNAPLAGHLGAKKTAEQINRYFVWPSMTEDIERHIKECEICRKAKYRTTKRTQFHVASDIPEWPWHTIHIDFKTGLPQTSRRNNGFILVVDKLTKRMHLSPCRKDITARQTGDVLFQEIIRHHGVPVKIISDRDPRFTSGYWKDVWSAVFTKLNMSTARHPQTDAQAERGIKTIVEMLRCFCLENPSDWDEKIFACEYAYNDSIHPSTGYTPFQLDMGRHPNTPIALLMKKFSDVRIDHTEPEVFLKEFAANISSTKARLNEMQKKQAKLLNSRTLQDHHYEVDEYVFMENPTVNDIRTLPALQERFLGPFRVMEVVQPGVYRLNTDKSDVVEDRHKP